MRLFRRSSGFSLVEAVFALSIALIASLGTLGAIVYTRQSMELDKQRLSALNVARSYMEQVHSHINVSTAQVNLVDFNTPINTPDLGANVQVDYFPIKSDGHVAWDEQLVYPNNSQPYYARVTVSWVPAGRWSGLRGKNSEGESMPESVVLSSIVRKSL
jgi:type II secretory pathway pseudopilin PulG